MNLGNILMAKRRIAGIACRTPLKKSALTETLGKEVFLKLETTQVSGAFKLRGAANKILALSETVRRRGVTTGSSGNHGRAVALLAQRLGIPAVVCLSEMVPKNKIEDVQRTGAEVIVAGPDQGHAIARARQIAEQRGMTYVDNFDDAEVIAGAGTIGLEILEEVPDIDTVIVPLSGGGLLSGVAVAAKSIRPSIQVIGVTMDRGAAMYESQKAGKPVEIQEVSTIADALQGGVGLENRYTFQLCRQYVDDFMLVTDEQIKEAMVYALKHERLVLEGAGAIGIALLRDRRAQDFGNRIATICSGGNVDVNMLLALASEFDCAGKQ